ncbi:MAG: WXG100 family type VII secretion target [Propionibacteriaceae bacterium]|jgi:WXG100 family type VII secretion target|nr:WXG100 family type VII secretion target [Propionibacteriaceae bacterium]
MPNVNVTYDSMDQAAGYLVTGKDELTTKLNDLQAYISNLISSGFVTDAASVRFGETYQEFTTGATQVISSLEGLSQFLVAAAQAMRDTDQGLAGAL